MPARRPARSSGRRKSRASASSTTAPIWTPFREALREAGYIDGQTIAFEYRAADGNPARLAAAAAELARLPVDLIATYGTPAEPRRQGRHVDDPDRHDLGRRSGAGRPGAKPRASGRQRHRQHHPVAGPRRRSGCSSSRRSFRRRARGALLWNPDNVSNGVILEQLRSAAPGLGLDVHRRRGAHRQRSRRRVCRSWRASGPMWF